MLRVSFQIHKLEKGERKYTTCTVGSAIPLGMLRLSLYLITVTMLQLLAKLYQCIVNKFLNFQRLKNVQKQNIAHYT